MIKCPRVNMEKKTLKSFIFQY